MDEGQQHLLHFSGLQIRWCSTGSVPTCHRTAQSQWRCTESHKEVLVQSRPLNYNNSFGFPWHPSRKVETGVADLLTKIMCTFQR